MTRVRRKCPTVTFSRSVQDGAEKNGPLKFVVCNILCATHKTSDELQTLWSSATIDPTYNDGHRPTDRVSQKCKFLVLLSLVLLTLKALLYVQSVTISVSREFVS